MLTHPQTLLIHSESIELDGRKMSLNIFDCLAFPNPDMIQVSPPVTLHLLKCVDLLLPVSFEVIQAALHHELSPSSVLSGSQQLLLPLLFAPVPALFGGELYVVVQ